MYVEKLKLVLDRVENIVKNGENAGYQHCLFFSTMFPKGFFLRDVKIELLCGTTFNPLPDNKILDGSNLKQIADNILKRI